MLRVTTLLNFETYRKRNANSKGLVPLCSAMPNFESYGTVQNRSPGSPAVRTCVSHIPVSERSTGAGE